MDREQTKQLIRVIASTYPNWKPQNISETVDAWAWVLEEYDYSLIQLALKTYIRSSGNAFAPSTAELIAMIRKPTELTQRSEGEAWALVRKAIKNGIYGAEQEFDQLPTDVQRAVVTPENIRSWAKMDSDVIDSVIASNFNKAYRTQQSREAEKANIPAELMALLGNASKCIEQKEDK